MRMRAFSPRCWFSLLIGALVLTAIPAVAQNTPDSYGPGYAIIPDTQERAGSIHYTSGIDDDLTYSGPLFAYSDNSIHLAPGYGRPSLVRGHLEVTYHFRVRYTVHNPYETPKSTFSGMVSNVMGASATSYTSKAASIGAVRPDGAGNIVVSAVGQVMSYPGAPGGGYGIPGSASDARTSYSAKIVSLGTSGTDANGVQFNEGTTQLKVTLDITAPTGTAEAHDDMWLGQAKTVIVIRPENQGQPLTEAGTWLGGILESDEYNADGSSGKGHSRYSNLVGKNPFDTNEFSSNYLGYDLLDENWYAGLIGSPWPVTEAFMGFAPLAQREWHWYDSLSGKATGNTSDGYSDPGPDAFSNTRPWHAYPWGPNISPGYIPLDFLDEMQNSALPQPDVMHTFFHIIDTDTSAQSQHPEWNFDKTANFYTTFHNRYEEAIPLSTSPTPLKDNPWHKYHSPPTLARPTGDIMQSDGLAPSLDVDGKPMPATGTYPWNPGSVTAYLENSVSLSLNCEYAAIGTDVNSGHSVTQNVPSKIVPVGYRGTVYYHVIKDRTTFNYKHYLKGGRHIYGFNPDGTEVLHKGQVDRSTGGIMFVAWVQIAGSDWPESTSLDLANM